MAGQEGFIGCLDVFVHQARDIHNICIYHKQDVYARLCLTSDPDTAAAATHTVNGGGRNPVFNQALRLGVRTLDASLKCEVWMLSRVKNYLEDQLLGFALVRLPEVAAADGGKLAAEFPLTSTDLFHSPAGFVQLSLSYAGAVPEVLPISPPPLKSAIDIHSVPREYEKIEFPDLMLVKENQLMVSEYFGMPCANAESQSSESLITTKDGHGCLDRDHEAGVRVVESFSTENSVDSTPLSSISTSDSAAVIPTAWQSPGPKDKGSEVSEAEADSAAAMSDDAAVTKPMIRISLEPEEAAVDHKEIMNMYMKSMQQFTDSLAKMKLPIDINNGSSAASSDEEATISSAEKKMPTSSKEKCSRVFYGSRAFF